jgi:NDP-sugar pyrophosphorylase family protein
MQAVILAAGRGKRMLHLTDNIPKPMLKINGKPLLEHKLETLPKEIDEVVIVIGYRGEHIMDYFGHEFKGKKIKYIFQKNNNGTGGALHLAKGMLNDKFLVMNGDDLYHKQDLKKMFKHNFAILGYKVDDPRRYGAIKTDKRGNMIEVIEFPKDAKYKLVNTGAFVLNKKFFEYDLVPKRAGDAEFGLPQTLAQMSKNHKIKVIKAKAWYPIGNPEDLEKAEEELPKFGIKVEKNKKETSREIQKKK